MNEHIITHTAEEIMACDAMHLGMDIGVCQWDKMEEDVPGVGTLQKVSDFYVMLKENTVRALGLSEMIQVNFPPYEETGKQIFEEVATVTFRLPEFITAENGNRELTLVFDFDKLTKEAREKNM